MIGKIARIVVIFLLVVAFLLLAALAGIPLLLDTDRGRLLVQGALNERIEGSLSWSSGRLSIWHGSLELRDLSLKDRHELELARVCRVTVILSAPELIRGTLAIQRLHIDTPRIRMELDQQGELNILEALAGINDRDEPDGTEPKQPPGTFPRNIILRDGTLTGGSFSFRSIPTDLNIRIEGIDLDLRGNLLRDRALVRTNIERVLIDDGGTLRQELQDIFLEGNYRKGNLEKVLARLATAQSWLALEGSVADLHADPRMDLTLKATVSPVELDQFVTADHGLRSPFHLRARLEGSPNNPDIDLAVSHQGQDGDEYTGPAMPLDSFTLAATLSDRVLRLERAGVEAGGSSLDVSGVIELQEVFPAGFMEPMSLSGLDGLAYRLALVLDNANLGHLPPSVPNTIEGIVTSNMEISGRGIDPGLLSATMAGQIHLEGFRYDEMGDPRSATLTFGGSMDKGRIDADSIQLVTEGASLLLYGSFLVETSAIDAQAALLVPDLAGLDLPLDGHLLQGALAMEADLAGSMKAPRLTIGGTAKELTWDDLRIGDITLAAALNEEGRVLLEEFTLSRDLSKLQARGNIDLFDEDFALRDDPPLTLQLEADPLRITDFTDLAVGKIRVSCDLSGSLRNPEGVIEVEATNLWNEYQDLERLSLSGRFDGDGFRLLSFRAKTPAAGYISASGRLGWDRSFEIVASSGGITLESLDMLKEEDRIQATVSFDLKGSGTIDDPNLQGDLAIRRISLLGIDHPEFRGGVSLESGIVRLLGNAGFDLDGSYHIDDGILSVALEARELSLRPYFLMGDIADLDGILDGRVTFVGATESLLDGRAEVDINRLSVSSENLGELWTEDVHVGFSEQILRLAPAVLHLPLDQSLKVQGMYGIDGSLGLSAQGEFPLALAGMLTEDLDDFTGLIRIAGQVDGTIEEPIMEADLEIVDGGFRVYSLLSPSFSDISGSLRLRGATVTLEGLEGTMDRAPFEASGTMLLRDMAPHSVDINLAGRNLPLDVPDTMNARLNADLTLRGQEGEFDLTGEIIILEALYYRDVRLRHLADAVTAAALPAPPPAPSPDEGILDSTRVNLSIRHRAPLSVSNNLAHLELVPDLKLVGTLANPVVNGRVSVQTGTIYYQRREFDVTRGVVDFLNPYQTEPTLDMESRVSVRERLITLRIQGPPDELDFNLTSEPPEEQGDILSLLLTGRTAGELTGQGQPGDRMQTSANMVAAIINATMAEDVRRTTGLDIFEIEAAGNDGDAFAEQFRVTMGKELSRRLAVKYSFETEQGELVQRISTEYQLLENILAGAFQDNRGIFGGGIRFRLEFY